MSARHFMGRTLQLTGLLALPSAIWAAEFQKNEALAIAVLTASAALFFIGWMLVR